MNELIYELSTDWSLPCHFTMNGCVSLHSPTNSVVTPGRFEGSFVRLLSEDYHRWMKSLNSAEKCSGTCGTGPSFIRFRKSQ